MLLSAASWHGSKYSLYALLFPFRQPSILPISKKNIIEWVGAVREERCGALPRSGTYFSNFVAVGPTHSGLSFSPSLSLAIVSTEWAMGCEDGI